MVLPTSRETYLIMSRQETIQFGSLIPMTAWLLPQQLLINHLKFWSVQLPWVLLVEIVMEVLLLLQVVAQGHYNSASIVGQPCISEIISLTWRLAIIVL